VSITIHEPECMECGEENLEEGGYLTYLRHDSEFILICEGCYNDDTEKYGLIYLEW